MGIAYVSGVYYLCNKLNFMAKTGGKSSRSIPEGKTQVNFNIDNQMLEKVKTIAFEEGVSNSDVFNKGVEKVIEAYEKKNGKIKPRTRGKGLESL